MTDGATHRDFLVRDHSAHDQRIAKQQSATRLQHAENFTQQPEAPRHMTQHIVRKHGIEALIRDWQRLRGITLLELAKPAQLLLLRQSVRISDPFGVQVQANNVAVVSLCQVQCVTARTATNL